MAAVSAGRDERLQQAVRTVRTRVGTADRARTMLVVGGVLLPLGLVVILLGWYGTARTPYGVEQTPYLVSGGLLGLAMVVAGSSLYVSYWVAQLLGTVRREGTATREALARLEGALAAQAGAATAAADRVVSTPSGTLFHRPDCPVMAGKRARTVRPDDPRLGPCKVCNPLG